MPRSWGEQGCSPLTALPAGNWQPPITRTAPLLVGVISGTSARFQPPARVWLEEGGWGCSAQVWAAGQEGQTQDVCPPPSQHLRCFHSWLTPVPSDSPAPPSLPPAHPCAEPMSQIRGRRSEFPKLLELTLHPSLAIPCTKIHLSGEAEVWITWERDNPHPFPLDSDLKTHFTT